MYSNSQRSSGLTTQRTVELEEKITGAIIAFNDAINKDEEEIFVVIPFDQEPLKATDVSPSYTEPKIKYSSFDQLVLERTAGSYLVSVFERARESRLGEELLKSSVVVDKNLTVDNIPSLQYFKRTEKPSGANIKTPFQKIQNEIRAEDPVASSTEIFFETL
jgi:hypothetical protein